MKGTGLKLTLGAAAVAVAGLLTLGAPGGLGSASAANLGPEVTLKAVGGNVILAKDGRRIRRLIRWGIVVVSDYCEARADWCEDRYFSDRAFRRCMRRAGC